MPFRTILSLLGCFILNSLQLAAAEDLVRSISDEVEQGTQVLRVGAPLKGSVDNTGLQMRIQRPIVDTSVYKSAPAKNNYQLNADHRELIDSATQNPVFKTGITRAARVLSTYDVELIVDRSMSMRKHDCPGFDSRWNWCGRQAEVLGAQLEPLVKRGVTVTTFATDYAVYEHLAPFQIESLFYNSRLQFGTRMAEPLQDRLQKAFQRQKTSGKPTLIAVITDGVPHPAYEPQLVVDVLVEASRQMKSANQIKVVFMQVGANDRFGKAFLNDLDKNLVSYGAKYDYVQTSSFDHLQKVGLAQALVDSISTMQISEKH